MPEEIRQVASVINATRSIPEGLLINICRECTTTKASYDSVWLTDAEGYVIQLACLRSAHCSIVRVAVLSVSYKLGLNSFDRGIGQVQQSLLYLLVLCGLETRTVT